MTRDLGAAWVWTSAASSRTLDSMSDVQLLPRTSDDEPFLEELFCHIRLPEFLPLGLPASALHQLLQMQFRAQTLAYATSFPDAEDMVLWSRGQRIGRLLVHRTSAEIHLVDIALAASARGQGVGSEVLSSLIAQATAAGLPLRLQVRSHNPAARLYQRLGFVAESSDGVNVTMILVPAQVRDASALV